MASDVMSLFGLDPSVIQQNRVNDAVSKASAMNPYYAAGAAGGALIGRGINTAFGLQTPEMQQAQQVQDSLQGMDLTTADGVEAAASELMANGQYAQSMALHAKAAEMRAATAEGLRAEGEYQLGDSRDITVAQFPSDGMTPARKIVHSVTFLPDGKVEDATQGQTFDTRAAWMDSLKKLESNGWKKPVTPNPTSNNAAVLEALKLGQPLPNGATATAEQMIGIEGSPEITQAKNARLQRSIDALTAQISSLPEIMKGSARAMEIQKRIDALVAQQSGSAYPSSGTEGSF